MRINSIRKKTQELSRLGYPFIPNRSTRSFYPPSLHPSTQVPSNLQLTDSRPFEASFSDEKPTHMHTYTHPRRYLIRCRDSPVSGAALLFCCVLTGRCWVVLGCECVQGFRGQSSAAASTPRCGLSLTCLAKRKALRTTLHMCTRW